MKHPKILGLHPSVYVEEFFGLVQPMTAVLFKSKKKGIVSYKFDDTKVNKIYLPRFGKGKFGNPNLITFSDSLWYSIASTLVLPRLLTYKKVLIHSPPFFQFHLVPLFRLFGREVYTIVIDAQLPLHNISIVKRAYYKIAEAMEYLQVVLSTKTFATSKYLCDRYRKWTKNVVYTPNGADVETISKIKPKRMFKEFTITYLGGFEMFRGIDLLIRAFQEIKSHGMKAKLLLIGGGPDLEKIKSIANNDNDIMFTGYMDHDKAISYCKGSDILVMPSRNVLASHTISSIKCFEYIACEVPSIVTDSGEHAFWTRKFGAGLIVKDNVKGIKEGILKLMNNKKLYNKIESNCKNNKKNVDYKEFKEVFVKEVLNG